MIDSQQIVFIFYTLIHLITQLSITIGTAYNYKNTTIPYKWIVLLLSFFIYLGIYYTTSALPIQFRFALFVLFSFLNGIVLSSVFKYIPDVELKNAALQTGFVFICMFGIGYLLFVNNVPIQPLSLMLFFLTGIMLALVISQFFIKTTHKYRNVIRSFIIGLLATYIAYDTYMNIYIQYNDDIINATLDYYTDVYGIFSQLLQHDGDD
jgi:FtsH-binding integral membrane protein